MSSFLLPEIIDSILSRLAVKPLLRFRCVSKTWCSLIDSPDFVKMQFKQSIMSKSNRHLILLFKDLSVHSIELHYLDFPGVDSIYSTRRLERPVLGTYMINYCNGLIHFLTKEPTIYRKGKKAPESDIVRNYIWNPFTRKYRELPAISFDFQGLPSSVVSTGEKHGFAYVAETDEYKVLLVTEIWGSGANFMGNQAHIFSTLSNEWEILEPFPYRILPTKILDGHLNGVLHSVVETDSKQLELMAFDTRTKKHYMLPMPNFDSEIFDVKVHVFEGNLCLLHIQETNSVEVVDIWVMKDYGVEASWFKLLSVALDSDWCAHPLIMTHSEDGAEVLLSDNVKKLKWYNLSGESVREVKVNVLPFTFFAEVWTERLVSLPGFVEVSVDDGKSWWEKKVDDGNKQSQQKRLNDKGNTSSTKGFLSQGFKLKL